MKFVDPDGRFNWDTNTIESGDTLTKITNEFNQKYSTHYSVDEVAKSCGIKNKDYIKAGDQLNFSKNYSRMECYWKRLRYWFLFSCNATFI